MDEIQFNIQRLSIISFGHKGMSSTTVLGNSVASIIVSSSLEEGHNQLPHPEPEMWANIPLRYCHVYGV